MLKRLFYATRRFIPRPARHLIYRAGMFFGDEFATPSGQFGTGTEVPSVGGTLEYLKGWGFDARTIVDVGAFRGDWTRFVKTLFPAARVMMIEPQDRWRPQLDDVARYYSEVVVETALVGAVDGQVVEFVEMANGSSVFEEQSHVARTRTTKETRTLNTLLTQHQWTDVNLLKIDVQGYELEVLKGATAFLSRCEFILVECSLIPVNRGCPLADDVITFLCGHGFRLFDVCSLIRRKDDAVWQTDLLFINDTSRWVPRAEITADNW